MAFNGSGLFVRVRNWATDKLNSLNPTAARFDEHDDDVAAGLSNCITKDGQTTITQNIPFNSKKITGLGDATNATDALNRQAGDARYPQLAGQNVLTGNVALQIVSVAPGFRLSETDAAANNKNWFFDANGEQLRFYPESDAFVAGANWLSVQRTANTIDSIDLIATVLTLNGFQVLGGEEGSYTGTLTGGTTAPTGTVRYVRTGRVVTLFIPTFSPMTSNANTMTITGALPASCQPARFSYLSVPSGIVEDNGAFMDHATLSVTASSILTFGLSAQPSAFTTSGTKGCVAAFTVSYLLT